MIKKKFIVKRHMELFLYNSKNTLWFMEDNVFGELFDTVGKIKYLNTILISISNINFVPTSTILKETAERITLVFKIDNNFEELACIRISK
jgi:hypothetical protein